MSADGLTLPIKRAADLNPADAVAPWLIEGLWARAGVGIVGGAPKSCKSWLALDIAVSLASDTLCLGAFAPQDPGPVLVYFAEDSQSVVKGRLDGLCARRALELSTLPIHVITAPTLRLDLERDRIRLDEAVDRLQPRMLLLDPFIRLHRIDENSAGEVSALLAYLRELQRTNDLAVIVVHHARKNGAAAGHAGQALRGSGDFHAWGDSNLYLRRSRDVLTLTIEHRAAPAPPPLNLALVKGEDGSGPQLTIVDTAGVAAAAIAPSRGNARLDDAVLQHLVAAPTPCTRPALRAALRVRNEALGDALSRLTAAGRIVNSDAGWSLAHQAVPVPTL
jgi:hypothetical protein